MSDVEFSELQMYLKQGCVWLELTVVIVMSTL